MSNSVSGITEKDAATEYARAWNRLDCTAFLEMLAPDAHYASQWVFDELESKAAISDYLKRKMIAVKNGENPVVAALGRTTTGFPGRDCVLLVQGGKEEIVAAVLFDVEDGLITRYDACIPQLLGVVRGAVYPI